MTGFWKNASGSWKVLEIFVTKRVGTLNSLDVQPRHTSPSRTRQCSPNIFTLCTAKDEKHLGKR